MLVCTDSVILHVERGQIKPLSFLRYDRITFPSCKYSPCVLLTSIELNMMKNSSVPSILVRATSSWQVRVHHCSTLIGGMCCLLVYLCTLGMQGRVLTCSKIDAHGFVHTPLFVCVCRYVTHVQSVLVGAHSRCSESLLKFTDTDLRTYAATNDTFICDFKYFSD